MARLFDVVLIADWSARAVLSPARESKDSIWIAADGAGGPEAPRYFRGRAAALDWLAGRLGAEAAAGRRVLAGFDFPFGWPRGAAARLTGRAEGLALWDWLAARVEDGADNANNRWAVAAAVNAAFGGVGPCWGRPRSVAAAGVPEKASARVRTADHPPERRWVEVRERGAKSCWQLAYAGAVGSQALLGMAGLARLCARPELAGRVEAWPFGTGWGPGRAPVVLAEVYPSMLAGAVAAARAEGEILDRAQVRVLAAAYAALDAAGGLGPLLAPPPGLEGAALEAAGREEAWILGRDHKAELGAALKVFGAG